MVIQKLISQPNHPKVRWQKAGGWTVVVVGDMRILQLITQLLTISSWPRNPRQTCPCNLLACKHASKQSINEVNLLATYTVVDSLNLFSSSKSQLVNKFSKIPQHLHTNWNPPKDACFYNSFMMVFFWFVWFSPLSITPFVHTHLSLSLSLAIRRRVLKVLNWSHSIFKFSSVYKSRESSSIKSHRFLKVFSMYFWSTKFQRLFGFPVFLIHWKCNESFKKNGQS
jgi:hypothetical protein